MMMIITAADRMGMRREVGLEDGGGEVGVAVMRRREGGCTGIGVGVGGEQRWLGGGGLHFWPRSCSDR